MAEPLNILIGLVVFCCMISCLLYIILPVGRSEPIRWPNLWPPLPKLPIAPVVPPIVPVAPPIAPVGPPVAPVNSNVIDACRAREPSNCPMTCSLNGECPSCFNCIDGRCQQSKGIGGICRRDSDCNCRQNLRCDTIDQKCVPSDFYFHWDEAMENCPHGARRGWFYDPFLLMSDSTSGDFQEGFRCRT